MDGVEPAPPARLTVSTAPDGAGLLVRLGGELDIAGLPGIEPALDALLLQRPQPLTLDLAELGFLDSSGLAVLIRLANHFGRVQVLHATAPVRRVIEALGLAGRLGLDGA